MSGTSRACMWALQKPANALGRLRCAVPSRARPRPISTRETYGGVTSLGAEAQRYRQRGANYCSRAIAGPAAGAYSEFRSITNLAISARRRCGADHLRLHALQRVCGSKASIPAPAITPASGGAPMGELNSVPLRVAEALARQHELHRVAEIAVTFLFTPRGVATAAQRS